MSKAQFSAEERKRLAEINAVDLEAARPAFERIARLAQALVHAPMVHISLVQADTLWLAGVTDQILPVVARQHAFTDAVIRQGEALWVADASKDERFKANPFVTGPYHFRFYAGAPIRLSNGRCIGALSVIDRKPRAFDAVTAERMAEFAALVADDWERRRVLSLVVEREDEARAANETLGAIIEAAPLMLAMTDSELNVVRASARWRERAADWVSGDLIGRSIREITPGAEGTWAAIRERCMEGHSLSGARARFVNPAGVARWVKWEITPWRDQDGAFGGLLVMVHEIGDMVEALEASERSEQRLKLATEMADLKVWEVDLSTPDVKVDAIVLPYEEVQPDLGDLSDKLWDMIHAADRPAATAAWKKHLDEGAPFRSVHRMARPGGLPVWIFVAAEAMRGPSGEIERVVGVTKNVDREKRSERAMAKALDAAEAANRAKSEFLANMSHEIRTPLNGVMGIAGALARTPLEPDQREMVDLIEASAGVLDTLLSDVLDIARIEAGHLELAREPFDLAGALKAAAALFEPKAAGKGISFETAIAPAAEAMVCGDLGRLRQIVSNLLSNAVKFTDAGKVSLTVEATRSIETVSLRLTVRDTGIGFDAATGAKLFKRFEQADGSITRRFGGSGLGLAISRSIADAMGGTLEAVSQPGKGAVFTLSIDLPRARGEGGAITQPPPTAAAAQPELMTDAPKVLLAEDHPTNRKVVALILEAVGVDLTVVEHGKAAVDAAETRDFDVILMDMQMPVMDGLTAIRLIRQREQADGLKRTPILALTANAMPEHARASAEAGADGHLSKPITAAKLVEAVRQAFESGQADPAPAPADQRTVAFDAR